MGKRFKQGFTLLEVMVVLVLVGIITSFAVLSMGNHERREDIGDIARQLAVIMELNQQEAILLGEQRGILFNDNGYDLRVFSGDNYWRRLQGSELFADYHLPGDIKLTLEVEGQAVAFNDAEIPQVLFFSSGEMTDFQLMLRTKHGAGGGESVWHYGGRYCDAAHPVRYRADSEQGFTLLEIMVALAVLAISLGAIIKVAAESASTISYLRERTIASWVAANKINETLLAQEWPGLGNRRGTVEMGW